MSSFKKLFDDTQAAFREQPEAAAATFSVESRLNSGFNTTVKTRQFSFDADEPEELGGTDQAPNPVEYLLAALSTCQEITYRLYADAMRIPVDGISVKLEGDLDLRGFLAVDDSVRPGYLKITGTVTLESSASEKDLARLKKAVDDHCPVLDGLRNPTPVELTINHVEISAQAAE